MDILDGIEADVLNYISHSIKNHWPLESNKTYCVKIINNDATEEGTLSHENLSLGEKLLVFEILLVLLVY